MTLTLRNDTSHPGGGYALLEGPLLAGVTAITIENRFAPGQFLGEDGKWGRNPFAFPIEENTLGVLSLGPHIVDHVPTELQVELRSDDGRALGQLFWADVIPSRNPGSVTTRDVLEERRRRAEQRASETAAALERLALDTAAQEQAVQEQAARLVAQAAAQAEASRRREADRARDAAAAVKFPDLRAEPIVVRPKRRSRWPLVAALVLLPLAAAAAFVAERPDIREAFRQSQPRQQATTPPQPAPLPLTEKLAEPDKAPEPYPAPAEPEPPKPIDCSSFAGRAGGLRGHSDADKVALGEEALHAGCGAEAFQAFDSSDAQASEPTAWYLAHFYDPNETDPVYRRTASIHPDFAAAYYKLWRDRSPRQAQALAKICEADSGGGASLRRSCGR